MQVESVERRDDGGADHHAGKPFVVGGHDVPRRMPRPGVVDHVLIGSLVFRPQRALCSCLETLRKNFRITVPLRARWRSKAEMSSKRSRQMSLVISFGGSFCL